MLIETFLSLIHTYITPKISHIDILTRQNKLLYASSEKLPPKKTIDEEDVRQLPAVVDGWKRQTDRQIEKQRVIEGEGDRGREMEGDLLRDAAIAKHIGVKLFVLRTQRSLFE